MKNKKTTNNFQSLGIFEALQLKAKEGIILPDDIYKVYDSLAIDKKDIKNNPVISKLKDYGTSDAIKKTFSNLREFVYNNKEAIEESYSNVLKDSDNINCPEDIISTLQHKLNEVENKLLSNNNNDWFNISEQETGGFASYKAVNEFYNKTPHLAHDIEIIINKVCQNVSYDKDKISSLKDKKDKDPSLKTKILNEFLEKLPLIVHNYLLYGVTYIAPERIITDTQNIDVLDIEKLNSSEFINKYKDLSKDNFRLRVLTPLECIPKYLFFDGILTNLNLEKFNLVKDWGWKQYDPFEMFYIYRSKGTIVENLILPVVSLSRSGNTDNKIRLRGGDESLLSRFMDLYVGLRLIEQTLLATIPFTNILTVKDASSAFSSLLNGDDYSDSTKSSIIEEFVNSAIDGSLPIIATSPNSETRFDSPVFEHLIKVYHLLFSIKNRAISGDSLKYENNTYDENNISFVHSLSTDVIEYLFSKYAKMIKYVYDIDISGYLKVASTSWFFNAHEKKIRAITKFVDSFSGFLVQKDGMSPKEFTKMISSAIGFDIEDSSLGNMVDIPVAELTKNYKKKLKTESSDNKKTTESKGSATIAESDNDNDND
jgi:hypothetical protein